MFVSLIVSFVLVQQEKCAQYWPTAEEREMAFRDTRFLVTLLSEDIKSYYTTRVLELQNISVGQNITKENRNGSRLSHQDASNGLVLFLRLKTSLCIT